MSRIVLSVLLALVAEVALAQARPQTSARTCAANQQSVAANGAIVLGTGGHIYDRFVRHYGFCQFDEFVEPAWVPARDRPSCFIGYRCKSGSLWDD